MEIELIEIRDFIAQHSPFDVLDINVINGITNALTIRYIRRGNPFPDLDTVDNNLYIIRTGAVEFRNTEDQLTAKLAEGDIYFTENRNDSASPSKFGKSRSKSEGNKEDSYKRGPKSDLGFPKKDIDSNAFETVYKGRGKDERPIFETVKKKEFDRTPGSKSKFIKNRDGGGSGVSPKYNLERIEKKFQKNENSDVFRLNKYISNSGICSRRDADVLIQNGEIKVNGEIITELGFKVERKDRVTYKDKIINPEKPVYILLNKPKDFITTTDDPKERKTVMQLIHNACDERVFPVGRLDRNTTGLLLFTNDGDLAAKLSHPSNEIKKIYQVTLDKPLNKLDEEKILAGLTLEDGPAKVDDLQVLSKDKTILGLEIHIGRNRIVRRIFAHLGYEVTALDRVTFVGLSKKDLSRGSYRFLNEKEVINLKFLK